MQVIRLAVIISAKTNVKGVYWPSEFIALNFGVLSAEIYDLGSRTMPGIEIEQYGILENFGS